MKILLLGGPRFLGRHLIESALSKGHEITLFNRGQTAPELYPQLEKLRGDRTLDLSPLHGRHWDVVIDTCGYLPRHVGASAALLAQAVEQYIFISSISAYASFAQINLAEDAPLAKLADESIETLTGETYGGLKALCEQAAERYFPGRALHVRSGLIVGPFDPTDRFTYWPWRVAQGGEVLCPGGPQLPQQFIDGSDLAAWIIRQAETRQAGPFNVTGPQQPIATGELLEICRQTSGAKAEFTWVSEEFMLQSGLQPWSEVPLWIPSNDPDSIGSSRVSIERALAAGLSFRPTAETVADTLAWARTRPADHTWRAGITRAREAEVLQAWHAKI